MRKWLLIAGAIVIAAWLVMWIGATVMSRLYSTEPDRAWPLGLGTLEAAQRRYPSAPASASAFALIDAAAKVGIDMAPRSERSRPDLDRRSNPNLRNELSTYLTSQTRKAAPAIDPLPPPVADYLAAHAGDLAAVRSILLGDEEVAWAVDREVRHAPLPNLLGHMVLTRTLVVNALDRARRGDAGAWQDLYAAVSLSRGLWKRPELISAIIALAIDRNVNAAARKLPLPAPAWFADFQKFDYRRAMMAARQSETSAIADAVNAEISVDEGSSGAGLDRMVNTVLSPYTRLCTADSLEADRIAAETITDSDACGVDPRMIPRRRRESLAWWNYPARRISSANLDSVWHRLHRFRAELEATDRALRLRSGASPLPDSSCSDGKWVYSPTGFRFSKEIQQPGPASGIPLEFALDARQ